MKIIHKYKSFLNIDFICSTYEDEAFSYITYTKEKKDIHLLIYKYDLDILLTIEEEILLSHMTKAITPREKSKKQRDITKTPPKTSITQRLQTDLGRSVWVTTATSLVWLNRFTSAQHSHLPRQPCNKKTHI